MQVYRSKKTGATFYAATPNNASPEFCNMAEKYGILLYQVSNFRNGKWDTGLKYFGKTFDEPFAFENNYLLLPTDLSIKEKYGNGVWQIVFASDFNSQFETATLSGVDNPSTTQPVQKPSLTGKSFYLDAGHGGTDSGAVNANFGLHEKIAALEICLKLGILLEKQGSDIYYSRTGDTYPSITARANQANSLNVTAFVSIHLNSADNKSANGIETLVYSTKGTAYELAGKIQKNMVEATKWTDRGIKARPDLGVLRLTKMPADLVECGFISNDKEAQELFKPEIQDKIAEAIANGIVEQFGN